MVPPHWALDHLRYADAGADAVAGAIDLDAPQSLPPDAVYGTTTTPALRLITCAGTFDRSSRSYRDNLVVSATRVPDGPGAAR